MKRFALSLAAGTLLLSASGCGTVDFQYRYWAPSGKPVPRCMVYSGVQGDFLFITEGGGRTDRERFLHKLFLPFAFLDLPWSLAADTALLPLTLGQTLELALRPQPQEPGEAPPSASPLLTLGQTTTKVLINTNEEWKFFKGMAEPSPGTTDWTKIGFNDAGWEVGKTPIGYGESIFNANNTTLSDMKGSYWSVYLRKKFTILAEDFPGLTQLEVIIQYDDGFIAYINGLEVGRQSMPLPGSPVDNTTPAFDHEYSAAAFLKRVSPTVSPEVFNTLVAGENIFAVQVHNVSLYSIDLVFIPRLGACESHPSTSSLPP
ncbi:MAG: YceK/YidQ family lipoprotein [Planctomycetes bacterium]|nr:YceK/YidQ family lipoprotein [Planctomycetota bacterium]